MSQHAGSDRVQLFPSSEAADCPLDIMAELMVREGGRKTGRVAEVNGVEREDGGWVGRLLDTWLAVDKGIHLCTSN